MNIGELAKFRAGIEIPASGTAVTTYLKAADTQGLGLVNSSGTSVVTVTDAGAVTVGPASYAGVHTLNGNVEVSSGEYFQVQQTSKFRFQPRAGANDYLEILAGTGTPSTVVASVVETGAWTFPVSAVFGTSPAGVTTKIQTVTTGTNYHLVMYKSDATTTATYFNYGSGTTLYVANNSLGVSLAKDGSTWGSLSDKRFKKNIIPIKHGLDSIMKLNPVNFDYSSEDSDNSSRLGFIAQEVVKIIPESIDASNEDKLHLTQETFIPVLVKSIQEQQAMIEELKKQVESLKKEHKK